MGKLYRVHATALNFRSVPDTSSGDSIIATLPRGHTVELIAEGADRSWWNVSALVGLGTHEGWVAGRYLTPLSIEPAAAAAMPGSRTVTLDQLKRLAPNPDKDIIEGVAGVINDVLAPHGISDNADRLCHFLAQAAHESGGFRVVKENLNYSAERLRQVWPSRFPDDATAQRYARKPEALANYVYANRIGNGNEASGDGWRYRGRGIFQLTGRGNYRQIGGLIGMDIENDPDMAADPAKAVEIAARFWDRKGLNPLADRNRLTEITRAINGGTNGLEDRRHYVAVARGIWG